MSAWPSDEQLAGAERLLRVPAANGAGRRSEGAADFFDTGVNGRQRFVPPLLAERLHREGPVAVGSTALYTYSGGAYRPHGEERLRRRIAELLGDRWRRNAADETIAFLRDSSPGLWECPPRNRINCANGILDLGTGRLERHDPEFLSPVQIAASYDRRAICPQIEKFLGEVLATELLPIVYELVGYLITPDNSLQRAFMFLGRGANGKSTLLNLVVALLGPQNVSAIPLHKLDEDRFASAELYGKLANVFADWTRGRSAPRRCSRRLPAAT